MISLIGFHCSSPSTLWTTAWGGGGIGGRATAPPRAGAAMMITTAPGRRAARCFPFTKRNCAAGKAVNVQKGCSRLPSKRAYMSGPCLHGRFSKHVSNPPLRGISVAHLAPSSCAAGRQPGPSAADGSRGGRGAPMSRYQKYRRGLKVP